MDPLVKIFPELHELVFQHFNAKDFVKITEVTPTWYEIFGDLDFLVKKVKLELNGSTKLMIKFLKNIKTTKYSTIRVYQNVYIGSSTASFKFSRALMKCFLTSHSMITKLEMDCSEFSDETEKFLNEIDFSKIEFLKLENANSTSVNNLLRRCRSLTHLQLECVLQDESLERSSIPSLKMILKRNNCLESLDLSSDAFNIFFTTDITNKMSLNLKSLTVRSGKKFFDNIDQNFIRFLENQSKSLERIDIHGCKPRVIEYIFNNVRALKYLRFMGDFSGEQLRFNQNGNIIELSIPNIVDDKFDAITQLVPNLRKLFTRNLTRKKLQNIATNLPKLTTIMYHSRNKNITSSLPIWKDWNYAIPTRKCSDPTYGPVWSIEKWFFWIKKSWEEKLRKPFIIF